MMAEPAAAQTKRQSDKKDVTYRRPGPGFYVATIVALVILVSLGFWQVRRLEWKEGLIATIQSRIAEKPKTLDDVVGQWSDSGDVDYQPIRLSGTFDHSREQHYLATYKGEAGWYLYTPLEIADGRIVIVNRGFVPDRLKDVSSRPWKPGTGVVGMTGLARNPLFAKPGWVVPDNDPAKNVWYWKDFPAMADAMGIDHAALVPFFVDVSTVDGDTGSGPIPGVTRIDLPNNHLQYVFTWFGLALALVVIAGYYTMRARGNDS